MYILNIGLDGIPVDPAQPSFTNRVRNSEQSEKVFVILRSLRIQGFKVPKLNLVQSDTEVTAVVQVVATMKVPGRVRDAIYAVAVALNQEAIALYLPIADKGSLIGPQAAKWGKFSPESFFLADGSRLSARGPVEMGEAA